MASEMETRLRGAILRIVRPSLDQVGDISMRLQALQETAERHEEVILMAEKLREEVHQNGELAAVLAEQMQKRENQARAFELETSNMLRALGDRSSDLEKRLDEQQVDIRKQARDVARTWEEAHRLQQQHDESHRKVVDTIISGSKRSEKNREEDLELIRELQRQRDALLLDIFGEGKGLTKLRQDLIQLQNFVAPLPGMESSLQSALDRMCLLEKHLSESGEELRVQREAHEEFHAHIKQKLLDMQDEFRRDTNRLAARHAVLMKEVRQAYSAELNAAKQANLDVTRFQESTEAFCKDIAESVARESRRLDALHREICQDMEEINKKRKKDRNAVDCDVSDVRRDIAEQQEMQQAIQASLEYFGRILGLVLEGERVASAISIQDFSDRKSQQWLALPSDAGREPPPSCPPELLEQRSLQCSDGRGPAREEVIPIDWRKGLLKAGYIAGQVPYGGQLYDRRDMLLLHSKLLQKAHAAFERGPPGAMPSSATAAAGQPGANGGAAAGPAPAARPGKARRESAEEAAEDPRLLCAGPTASRQRPGSQGQPQALGSRGSMGGPLGDTVPPGQQSGSQRPSLRLPSIGDSGASPLPPEPFAAMPSKRMSLTAR